MDKGKEIYLDIRRDILKGKLRTGDRLVETQLAAQYNTSRLHVKSAFRLLEAEQLVKYVKMRGFFVQGVLDEDIREFTEIRQALESVVIKKVIKTASVQEIDALRRISQRVTVFVENNMIEDALQEVDLFYDRLYDLCHYQRVVSILKNYSDYISIIRSRSARSEEEHRASSKNLSDLVDAIARRDEEKAIRLMQERVK